ncbi:MAG: response regulator [Candidatus Omnitrophica bacterium]|nr:response regulator [Candidatus Omnitrophota bacterium]
MQRSRKILVVDDEEDFLSLIKIALEERGFEVVTSTNAIDAGIVMSSTLPAVILMDIKMPGINGFQACEAIKKNPVTKDLPIIVLSALSDESDIKKAQHIGVADYFVKPVNIEKLISKIRELAS